MGRARVTEGLAGASKLLKEKLAELVDSLAPGTPLPPAKILKAEFGVGYEVLRRAMASLEKEGRVVIRKNKGVFPVSSPVEGAAASAEGTDRKVQPSIPWGHFDDAPLKFLVPPSWMGDGMWRKLVDAYNRTIAARTLDAIPVALISGEFDKEPVGGGGRFDMTAASSHLAARKCLRDSDVLDLRLFAESGKSSLGLHAQVWDSRPNGEVKGVAPLLSMTLLAYRKSAFPRQAEAFTADVSHAKLLELVSPFEGKAVEDGGMFVFLGYMSFFFRFGVELWSRKAGKVSLSATQLAPVFEFLRRMSVEKSFSPFCSESYRLYESDERLAKNAGVLTECHTAMPFSGNEYGFSSMPLERGGSHPLFMPVISLSAETPYPEAAWNFVRFVLGEEGQRIVAAYPFGLPAARDVAPAGVSSEKLAAMWRTVADGRLAYADSETLYRARFVIEMLIEKALKLGWKVEQLQREIEERANRFMGIRV